MRNFAGTHYVSGEIEKNYLSGKAIAKTLSNINYLSGKAIAKILSNITNNYNPHFRMFLKKFYPFPIGVYPLPLPLFIFTNYTFQKGRLLKRNF